MRHPIRTALVGLAALIAVPALAQAREIHAAKAVAKPQTRAAIAASEGFSARMSRLDALMGTSAPRSAGRSRSANAEY